MRQEDVTHPRSLSLDARETLADVRELIDRSSHGQPLAKVLAHTHVDEEKTTARTPVSVWCNMQTQLPLHSCERQTAAVTAPAAACDDMYDHEAGCRCFVPLFSLSTFATL